MARWLEKLQEYQFGIVHRQGRKHTNTDALSHLPCQCGRESHQVAESPLDVSHVAPPSSHLAGDDGSQGNSHLQNLRQAQLGDPGVAFVLRAKENASKPSSDLTKSQSLETCKLLQQWDQLEVRGGLLACKFEQEGKGVTHQ